MKEYLDSLPADRRAAIAAVRKAIRASLPKGYAEVMQYGMISYVVPLKTFPAGYLDDDTVPLPYVSLASQKSHMAVYMMGLYGDPATEKWFRAEYKAAGKKLDMGKSCVRFKKLDDLPLALIGKAVARVPVKAFVAGYEKARGARRPGRGK